MKTGDLAKALRGMAKKGLFVNHQETQLLKEAALTVEDQARRIAELERQLAQATQTRMEIDGNGIRVETRILPTEEAKEDFWAEDNCE